LRFPLPIPAPGSILPTSLAKSYQLLPGGNRAGAEEAGSASVLPAAVIRKHTTMNANPILVLMASS